MDNINGQLELRQTQSQQNLIIPSTLEKNSDEPTNSNDNSKHKEVLSTNTSDDSSASITKKRSPIRTGIMSRLTKSPLRIKRNNVLLNALPINLTPSPTKSEVILSTFSIYLILSFRLKLNRSILNLNNFQ